LDVGRFRRLRLSEAAAPCVAANDLLKPRPEDEPLISTKPRRPDRRIAAAPGLASAGLLTSRGADPAPAERLAPAAAFAAYTLLPATHLAVLNRQAPTAGGFRIARKFNA
jgi:hypothetical protein